MKNILWSMASLLILTSGLYFTIKLKFLQFNCKRIIKSLISKKNKKGITPIKSLFLSLAARIGIGSIAGVALAIHYGGPGTVFWMWVSSLISGSLSYCETYLSIKYREPDGCTGGPSYYLKKGLNSNLSIIYAIIIIISYIAGFISIQANTITKSINEIININPNLIGIILVIITSIIIYGGLKNITSFTSKIVPIMTIFYLTISFIIIFKNINMLDDILYLIFRSALNFKAGISGFLITLIIGIERGIFSNESGLGTMGITASTTNGDIKSQGYIQILGNYVTTFLICTATSFVILSSNYELFNSYNINGIELAQFAFKYHLGLFGEIGVFISILLFSFTTIIAGYYDGEVCLKFFTNKYINILKILSLIVLFLGTMIQPNYLWDFIDILTAFLAFINIYALIKLKNEIKL